MRIKNWAKFQHFKDRTPPWIKLYKELIDDPDWHALDAESAKILVMLWLIASEDETMQGLLPDHRKLAFRLRITEKALNQALNKLLHWVEHDDNALISSCYRVDAPETETETETEKPKKIRETKINHELPEDFTPNESGVDYAKVRCLDVFSELESFKNHHSSKGTKYRDWQAAWRTWCGNAVRFGRGQKQDSFNLAAGAI